MLIHLQFTFNYKLQVNFVMVERIPTSFLPKRICSCTFRADDDQALQGTPCCNVRGESGGEVGRVLRVEWVMKHPELVE